MPGSQAGHRLQALVPSCQVGQAVGPPLGGWEGTERDRACLTVQTREHCRDVASRKVAWAGSGARALETTAETQQLRFGNLTLVVMLDKWGGSAGWCGPRV